MTLQESIAHALYEKEWKNKPHDMKYFHQLPKFWQDSYLEQATKIIERSDIKLATN